MQAVAPLAWDKWSHASLGLHVFLHVLLQRVLQFMLFVLNIALQSLWLLLEKLRQLSLFLLGGQLHQLDLVVLLLLVEWWLQLNEIGGHLLELLHHTLYLLLLEVKLGLDLDQVGVWGAYLGLVSADSRLKLQVVSILLHLLLEVLWLQLLKVGVDLSEVWNDG